MNSQDPVLEHSVYYHPDTKNDNAVDFWYWNGSWKNLTEMQAIGKEDDLPIGMVANPSFKDPNGSDNIYG